MRDQKELSRTKQAKDGKDNAFDILVFGSAIKNIVDRSINKENRYYLSPKIIDLLVSASVTKGDLLECIGEMELLNKDEIVGRINELNPEKLGTKKGNECLFHLAPKIAEHAFLFDRGTRILNGIKSWQGNRDMVKESCGIDIAELFQKYTVEELLSLLLLPKLPPGDQLKKMGFEQSLCRWDVYHHKHTKNCNVISLLSINHEVFTKQNGLDIRSLFVAKGNTVEHHDFAGNKITSVKEGLPLSFVSLFWLLLLSYLSKESSDEVLDFLCKVTPPDSQQCSKQNTSGDASKAKNGAIMTLVKVMDELSLIANSFNSEYTRKEPGKKTAELVKTPLCGDFSRSYKPESCRFMPFILDRATKGAVRSCRNDGIDPYITGDDRRWLGAIVHAFCQGECCDAPDKCECA